MTNTDGEKQMVAQGSASSAKRNTNSVVCVAAEDKSSSVTVAEHGVSVPSKKPRMRVGPPPKGTFAQRHGSEHKAQISDVVPNDFSGVNRPPAEESVVQQQDASTLSAHVKGNDSSAVTVIEKSSAEKPTEKKNEGPKYARFLWDLNLPMEAWGQPCDFEDEASGSKEVVASDGPKADEAAAGKGKEC